MFKTAMTAILIIISLTSCQGIGEPMLYYSMPEERGYSEDISEPMHLTPAPKAPKAINHQMRKVIYNADLTILVEHITSSEKEINRLTSNYDGWIQASSNRAITLRVPTTNFSKLLKDLKNLGTVTNHNMTSQDVTEKFNDTELRLKNAENTHKRLSELYKKAIEIEDVLKIEKELNRISETIELLKGKIRYLKNRVGFATITVRLNQPSRTHRPQRAAFYWIDNLASGINSPLMEGQIKEKLFGFINLDIEVDYPKNFVTLSASDKYNSAMTADGIFVRIQTHKIQRKAEPSFWTKLARKHLQEKQLIKLGKREKIRSKDYQGLMLNGNKYINGIKTSYQIAIFSGEKSVCTLEIFGPEATLKNTDAIKVISSGLVIDLD